MIVELVNVEVDALPEVDSGLMRELGLARTEGAPSTLAERLLLPSLNIRGMQSATVGPTARNVIPTHADASLDLRLVLGNDPEQMLYRVERHIAAMRLPSSAAFLKDSIWSKLI